MGATPGSFGTTLSQAAWLPVMRTLGTELWTGGRLMLPKARNVFDDGGSMVDQALRERLEKFLQGFVQFVGQD
jgi:NAD(P)H-dependent FMN reductase